MNPEESSKSAQNHFRGPESVGSVVTEHLRQIAHIARNPEQSKEALSILVGALQRTSGPNPRVLERAKDGELRRAIGLAIGSTELESYEYTLEHVGDFLVRHGEFINTVLTHRELAEYLGPALLAPMLFDRFQSGRDALALETTASRLRSCISKSALEVWESLAARSIVWAYDDPIVSPCPFAYQNALGMQQPIVRSLESYEDEHQLVELVGALSAQGFSIPLSLWKVSAEEVKEDIVRTVPLAAVLSHFKSILKSTRDESKQLLSELRKLQKNNRHSDPGEVNEAEEQIDRRFSRLVEDLSERISLFKEFIHLKEQDVLLDPIHQQLAPRTSIQKADHDYNPVAYYEARFREYLQKALAHDLIVLAKNISKYFAEERSFAPVTKEFVCALTEVSEECGIFLDDEIATKNEQQSFQERHLLPAFFKYIGRGDIESAQHIRLLFPESSCECIQYNRHPIDDVIAEHQKVIADGMFRVAKRIAIKAPRWLHAEDVAKQESIEREITAYREALTQFVHNESNAPIETRFIDGVVEAAVSLIKADVVRTQNYSNKVDPKIDSDDSVPMLYRGAKNIAALLSIFDGRPDIRIECMANVCRASNIDVLGYISEFIASSNEQLVRSLQWMKGTRASLQSIERECENVFAAETVYLSIPKKHRNYLPVPISKYLQTEMCLGYGVLRTQHGLHSESSVGINQPLNARRLQLWSEGLIGEHASPLRREFLNQFFRQLRAERRMVPKELQPLVFDALEQYAKCFMENVNQSSSDAEFREGLVIILGGFLLSSHEMQGARRMELARVLSRVFVSTRSEQFCPPSVLHNDVAAAFQALLVDTLQSDEQAAMNTFMNTPSISGILTHLGLLDRSDRVDPTV